MTGCDLKFMAEEAIYRASRERSDLRVSIGIITDDLAVALDSSPVAQLVATVATIVERLREAMRYERTACSDCVTAGLDTIEKVREHFHEAVDQRVSEHECECDCSDDVSDARSELLSEVRAAIERALDRI